MGVLPDCKKRSEDKEAERYDNDSYFGAHRYRKKRSFVAGSLTWIGDASDRSQKTSTPVE